MLADVPYVKPRRNKNGTVRWYWVRPGFKTQRLKGTAIQIALKAAELNERAQAGDATLRPRPKALKPEQDPLSLAYWVKDPERGYLVSGRFKGMAYNSRKGYRREAERMALAIGAAPIAGITEMTARAYLLKIPTVPRKLLVKNALKAILVHAVERAAITSSAALAGIEIRGKHRRSEMWLPGQIAAFLGDCRYPLRIGFALALYTGQRISDVLKMTWRDFDGEFVDVAQQKTDKKLAVYCHADLRRELAAAPRWGLTIVAGRSGRPVSYNGWRHLFDDRKIVAGVAGLVTHDLRRTAVTRLAEAGNDTPSIGAVTGHSARAIQVIIDTYVVKTRELSRGAVVRLEEHQKRLRENAS